MHINTTRFGRVTIDGGHMLEFPDGLPGFESARRFVLLPHPGQEESESPFRWMQCADDAPGADALAFPVISPWLISPNYAPTVPAPILRELGIDDFRTQAQFWAIISIPRDHPEQATVNLLAPVLVNSETRESRQVILLDDHYDLRTPLHAPNREHVQAEVAKGESRIASNSRSVAVAAH